LKIFSLFIRKYPLIGDSFRKGCPVLVAFSGKAGSGKSTLANHLVTGYGFVKFSFADELKRLCQKYFPLIMAQRKEVRRKLLQEIGMLFRKFNPYVWINFVVVNINRQLFSNPNARIVIDDLRFKNEAHTLALMGFNLIRIERDAELRKQWGYDVYSQHISEVDLDDWQFDQWVQNNGNYPFEDALKEILEYIGVEEYEGTEI